MQKLIHIGSTYETRISFNTFDNKDATDISFTILSRHKNFVESRRSRTFLCGMCSLRPRSRPTGQSGSYKPCHQQPHSVC